MASHTCKCPNELSTPNFLFSLFRTIKITILWSLCFNLQSQFTFIYNLCTAFKNFILKGKITNTTLVVYP